MTHQEWKEQHMQMPIPETVIDNPIMRIYDHAIGPGFHLRQIVRSKGEEWQYLFAAAMVKRTRAEVIRAGKVAEALELEDHA